MTRKYNGLAIPDNLRAFNEAYRQAEREFSETGTWKFTPPGADPSVQQEEKKEAA